MDLEVARADAGPLCRAAVLQPLLRRCRARRKESERQRRRPCQPAKRTAQARCEMKEGVQGSPIRSGPRPWSKVRGGGTKAEAPRDDFLPGPADFSGSC